MLLRTRREWVAFYLGNDGKRRFAEDISIPADMDEAAIVQYLADLFHEWATPNHPGVQRVD